MQPTEQPMSPGRKSEQEKGSESMLIQASQRGDKKAFEQLMRLYKNRIQGQINNSHLSHADADDIFQEVQLTLWKSIKAYQDNGFISWVFTITRNKILDWKRKTVRERVDILDSIPDPSPTADVRVIAKDQLNKILGHEELTPKERNLAKNLAEEPAQKELSRRLHTSQPTVSRRISEVRRKINDITERDAA